jgi:hypothetical protein
MVISCLAVSLVASAITLVISSLMKLRETTLLKGVQDLLNDQDFSGIARDLYNHALVNPLASGTARVIEDLTHKPAYIFPAVRAGHLRQAERECVVTERGITS